MFLIVRGSVKLEYPEYPTLHQTLILELCMNLLECFVLAFNLSHDVSQQLSLLFTSKTENTADVKK